MSKTKIEKATETLAKLEAKQVEFTASAAADERELSEIAYAAHTGEQKAQAKLEALKDRALRRDLEMKALASAIAESKRRVAAAQEAEAMAEAARVAEELAELADLMREAGAKADKGLAMMIEGSNDLRKVVQAINARGLGSPSAQQLQSLGSRAILGAIVNSPFAKSFEHLAPRERQSFKSFAHQWAEMIERHVGAQPKKEAADERAA
jgi:hypothetical protein